MRLSHTGRLKFHDRTLELSGSCASSEPDVTAALLQEFVLVCIAELQTAAEKYPVFTFIFTAKLRQSLAYLKAGYHVIWKSNLRMCGPGGQPR
jgi:hypothetical protein